MSEPLLTELQARFRETTRARLQDMRTQLARLESDPSDAEALQRLSRAFHALSGLGGTYGFPRISELGDEAEGTLAQGTSPVPAELFPRWRTILDAVAEEIGEGREMRVPEQPSCDVLLVVDDAELASTVTRALLQERASVRRCLNAETVAAELDFSTPDVVILDLQLPDGSAPALLETVRRSPHGETIGIVAVGDASDLNAKVRALRGGANVFLPKPLDLPLLVRRVMSFRERQRRAPARVLVVEDDPTQIAILRKVLGNAGYEVIVCTDASRFESILPEAMPDLLLMDIHLDLRADVSGFDLVRLLRQHEEFAHLPVIFVSGDRERDALVSGAMSGGDTFVTKPVDWALLLSHIQSSLERASVLRDRTEHDALSGVLTRGAFVTRAAERLSVRGRRREPVIVILDLDHFKQVNDTYGHGMGDRVLSSFGSCLRRGVRQHHDLVGRYGGEEFVLLLEDVTPEDAVKLIERLLADFSTVDHGNGLRVTFSAGVAVFADSLDATLGRADAALYEAKRAGRARVVPA
ncbi:MAG TPA: response regulator [Thermoanaerobaculia bacterium]|nr:response regulator [Thermoanaerobaculia bacterium]